jgi:hypothetical protein
MKKVAYILVAWACVFSLASLAEPTFGDLAVLLAKGYFKEYVPEDASLEECVGFLNDQGVCFSLFDVMDRKARVSKEDFARAVGQSKLLFLGEAEVYNGCIKRPLDVSSWVDYCLLNDIGLIDMWHGFSRRVEKKSLPEVIRFFEKGS